MYNSALMSLLKPNGELMKFISGRVRNRPCIRLCALHLAIVLLLASVSACSAGQARRGAGAGAGDGAGASEIIDDAELSKGAAIGLNDVIEVVTIGDEPWLEYSIDLELTDTADTLDNLNDIVTPYIENRFHIRVSDVAQGYGQKSGFFERLDLSIASGSAPDVIIAGNENCTYAVSTGVYGDLTAQIEKMDNLNMTFDPIFWPRFMNAGQKTQIPITGPDVTKEPYASDPYVTPMASWGLWIREDILAQCGYAFTPLKDIERRYLSRGLIAPMGAYAIDPPIKTPEDFNKLLNEIRKLKIEVDGYPLIPWSSSGWSQFHMGCMFDFGQWRIDPATGTADGYLGSPDAKVYYKFLNKLFQEGLIDKDFTCQNEETLQTKIESGRVAMGIYIPDAKAAQGALFDAVGGDAVIRFIEWPKRQEGVGAFDVFENGFWRLIIRDGFADKDRLTQYFDWFYSKEGQDILTWGPEDAGLWTSSHGVKQFVDPTVENDCLNGVTGGRGADYWGLFTVAPGAVFPYLSKAGICAPYTTVNLADYRRSYPPKLDGMLMNRAAVSLGGYDCSSRYAYGDGSAIVSQTSLYYWTRFLAEDAGSLLMAKDDAEFDGLWSAAYDKFLQETDYLKARQMMADWFSDNGNDNETGAVAGSGAGAID